MRVVEKKKKARREKKAEVRKADECFSWSSD
jgi:hypothetical protein